MKFHLSFELLNFFVCITPISFGENVHETFKNWTSFRYKEFAQVVNAYILWSYWCLWWILQNRRKRNILMPCMLAKVIKKVFDAKYFKQSTRIDLKKQQSVNVERGSMNMFFWWDCMDCHWKICLVGQSSSLIEKDGDKLI